MAKPECVEMFNDFLPLLDSFSWGIANDFPDIWQDDVPAEKEVIELFFTDISKQIAQRRLVNKRIRENIHNINNFFSESQGSHLAPSGFQIASWDCIHEPTKSKACQDIEKELEALYEGESKSKEEIKENFKVLHGLVIEAILDRFLECENKK